MSLCLAHNLLPRDVGPAAPYTDGIRVGLSCRKPLVTLRVGQPVLNSLMGTLCRPCCTLTSVTHDAHQATLLPQVPKPHYCASTWRWLHEPFNVAVLEKGAKNLRTTNGPNVRSTLTCSRREIYKYAVAVVRNKNEFIITRASTSQFSRLWK